ncbi:MAG: hypothetical protein Q8916_00055 [Bacteroidota bacterium]|nr:hypothetical protein [Bacteroidota bacterium]MDP4228778.1 hypothetical protein [Bacteroidota bacterium]MDP4237613.1 hypothetical protein [Bacteroidota bacterium]
MKTSYFSVALLALVVFASGCGPSLEQRREEIDKSMKSWIGKSENELVARWGVPSKTYKTNDGTRELTYIYKHTSSSPGYSWVDYWGNVHYSHPVRHQKTTERSFTVDQTGTIVDYHWEGF